MDKKVAGFKFGINSSKLIETIDEYRHNGRLYRLCKVEVDGQIYHSLRLYNGRGKFIKQFMTEPELAGEIAGMYALAATGRRVPV